MSDSVVVATYTESAAAAGENVRYIARREDGARTSRVAALYSVGPRYSFSPSQASEQLARDGEGLVRARYYRLKLTCTDDQARRIGRLGPTGSEAVLRAAGVRAIQGVSPRAAGVLAVHGNGGDGRPFGHPHVHVVLSPRDVDGRRVDHLVMARLETARRAWEQSLEHELRRRELTSRPESRGENRSQSVGREQRWSPAPPATSSSVAPTGRETDERDRRAR